MVSEYTPSEFEPFTDEEMREIFLHRDLEEWAKLNPQHRNASGEDWDRWLAAHDAEVRASVVAEEPEWEYGVTTKWGVTEHPHIEAAERYAADVRAEIKQGRASGDLAYHGRVMKRTQAKAGPWEPVN